MADRFTTPVGRLLQGDPFTAQDKDMTGAPRVIKRGPNAGQPNPQYYIGVGFRKDDPQWPIFRAQVDRVAQAAWPQGQWQWPTFAWKIIDGDSPERNRKGRPWNSIEGFPGHWVCRFASSYPPKCFHAGRYQPADQILDKNTIRRGYFVRVNGSMEGNGETDNPGIYLNLDLVELAGYGPEITSGPDVGGAFAQPGALPPGASATPVLPGGPASPIGQVAPYAYASSPGGSPPDATNMGPHGALAYGAVAPPPASLATPLPAVAPPYAGFMPGVATAAGPVLVPTAASVVAPPPPASFVPPATPSPIRTMLPAANGIAYEQYIAGGWTDAQLVAQGMMAP